MMFACGLHLYTDGLFSYAGFVSLEVLTISTIMSTLMLLDAISALKCTKPREQKVVYAEGVAKVAAGADYESEDEKPQKRIIKKTKLMD